YIGGLYIWDWVDQGVLTRTPEGTPYIGYGGDFGEVTHGYTGCLDGIMLSDLSNREELIEVGYCYQNASFSWEDEQKARIRLNNKNYYIDASNFQGSYELLCDGAMVKEGVFKVPSTAPQGFSTFETPVSLGDLDQSSEWVLNLYLETTQEYPWGKKGTRIVREQLEINSLGFSLPEQNNAKEKVSYDSTENCFKGPSFKVKLNTETGLLEDYQLENRLVFLRGPRVNFWRPPTCNDAGSRVKPSKNKYEHLWRTTGGFHDMKHTLKSLDIDANEIRALYDVSGSPEGGFKVEVTKTLYSSGNILFHYDIEAHGKRKFLNMRSLPKIGTQCILPQGLENMSWYGHGPYDNYSDRRNGTLLGHYSSTVDEQYMDYPYPQDYGNKTGVRWVSMENESGHGLMVSGNVALTTSARHYSDDNITEARHTYDLEKQKEITFNIDLVQSGVGNNSCGGNPPLEPYRVKANHVSYSFVLAPMNSKK
ncbi:MAG: DUF4981 domain-containing protein, partial [Planctomycetes bacterium]|nr:DUF4981 domain-containing protein [Planctomycetota bacterium]